MKIHRFASFHRAFLLPALLCLGFLPNLFASPTSQQKEDKSMLSIIGRVKDAMLKKDLVKAKVYLTDSLGNHVDSTQTGGWITGYNGHYNELAKFTVNVPRRPGNYLIEVKMPDYEDTYYSLKIDKIGRREYERDIPDIFMQPASKKLDEVVVTQSKVKFYHKGDTVVFNADAFKLAEGSMLDALIKQLPGVELKEGGRIYVNGEFVENLLLNGKDFFKGKNELMLDNLAAYTVKDIEVYKKSSDYDEWSGNKGKQDLVMDVKLKREYNAGWLMNFEAGAGSSERYMGRAFINRFSNNSRISLIGNVNNLNDNRKPGESSTWTPETNTTGTITTQLAGLDYYVQQRDEKWEMKGDATFRHSSQTDHRETSRLNFFGSDRTSNYDFLNNKSRSLQLTTSHGFTLKSSKAIYLGLVANGSYNHNRSDMSDIGGAFRDEQPTVSAEMLENLYSGSSESLDQVINRSKIKTENSGHSASAYFNAAGGWKVPHTSDYINYGMDFTYNDNKNEVWRDYMVNYGANPVPALRQNRYYDDSPNRTWTANGYLGYQYTFTGDTRLSLRYNYTHSDMKRDSYAYALDRLEEEGIFGTLPAGYLSSLDASLSYRSHYVDNYHTLSTSFSHWTQNLSIYLTPQVRFFNRNFDYFRNNNSYHVDQHHTLFIIPQFSGQIILRLAPYKRNGRQTFRHTLSLLPSIMPTMPDPVKMINIVDDNDPMNIWTGNPGLKPSYNYKGFLQWRFNTPIRSFTFSNLTEFVYSYTHNTLVNGYRYDSETGVRTHRTFNVPSGNTSANFHVNPSLQFGSKGQFTLSYFGGLDFIRTADMIGYDEDPVKSQVKTLWNVQKLDFSWQLGKQVLGLKGEINSRHTDSDQTGFTPITGTQSMVMARGQFTLPKGFGASADFSVFMRRGYGSPELDNTQSVMNMRLSYTPPKSRFVFMLDGFDLFHQLSNVSYAVNSQGRTIVVNNVLPRYVMFHVQYRLNIQPKKKIIDTTYRFN